MYRDIKKSPPAQTCILLKKNRSGNRKTKVLGNIFVKLYKQYDVVDVRNELISNKINHENKT